MQRTSGLLDGEVAFVTGAARGIGRAVAARFAEAGAAVCLADLDGEEAARSAALLGGEHAATGLRVDVTDPASLEAAIDAAERALGPATIAVVNAGVLHLAPTVDLAVEQWRRVLEVNLTGSFLTARAFARRLTGRGAPGRIIFSASLFGLRGGAENAAYSASKFGTIGLMQCLAAELAPHGVLVNAVCPGQVRTEMIEELIAERARLTGRTPEEVEADLVRRLPMGRMAGVEEVADAYVYLASGLSRYTTGQSLVLDGGWQVA